MIFRPFARTTAVILIALAFLMSGHGAATAQDVDTVRVRAGAHDVYTRLVFDWREKVTYEVSKSGGLVTLTFAKAANIDAARVNKRLPLYVGGIRSARTGDRTVVVVAVPPKSKIKNFYAGNRVVLDVREPAEWQEAAKLPDEVEVPGTDGTLTATASTREDLTAFAAQSLNDLLSGNAPSSDRPAAQPAQPAQPARPAPAAPAAQGPATQRAQPAQPAQQPAQRSAQPRTQPSTPLSLTPPARRQPAPAQAAQPTLGPAQPTAPAAQSTAPAAQQAQPAQAQPAQAQQAQPAQAPGAQLSVAQGDDGSLTVRFEWDEPVAAAAFRRSGFLWLVFDKRANVNVAALQQASGGVIQTLQQLYIPQATVLRMKTLKGMNPSVRRQGLAWLIDFRVQDMIPRVPVDIQVQPDSQIGARLFMPLPEPGKVIPLTDPLVGDSILVIPAVPLGHGIAGNYRYPQFEIQQSAQGIVITPKIDDVRVRALRQGIEIASAAPTHPLKFSPVSQEQAASARAAALRPLVRLLDLEKWETRNPAAILQTRFVLENAVARVDDSGKQAARMDLARFYFANAYASEALGVLSRVLEVDKNMAQDREYMLLRGASKAMIGRLEEARQDLYSEILNGNDEAEFWRAIVQAKNGDMNGASIELRRSGSMARPYPRPLRFPLSTVVAEAMVTIGDSRNAETQIQTLQADGPDKYQEAQLKYVQGRLAELEGDFDGAVTLWEDAMLSKDRLARYRSGLARAELLMRLDRITRIQGIAEMEKQRFAWRGDDREFDFLRRLGDLYLEQKLYRQALQTLKQAATHFRDHPQAPAVTKLMSDTFNALYLEDEADALKPVTAIAIYEEFKELTPAGAAGDRMIQKLADRLVGVDLLKEAAALLENQIKFRLRGVDRARVGARLSLIHMLDRKFADAERVIKATEAVNLPPELATQRTYLLVQALMGQRRYNDGLALIANDERLDAELLRAEIYWSMANWVDATQSLQTVVNLAGATRGQRLNPRQARYMLNLATAMTLSGNERGLARIRANFASAMAETEYARAFTLIAARPALSLIAPSSVAERVKVAENFKSFLTAYREKLEQNPLSAIN